MKQSRLLFLGALATSWALGISVRLYDLQVLKHDQFRERAERQQQRVVRLDAPRGTIYDARGRELAVSIEARSVAADPSEIEDPEAAATLVATALGLEPKKLRKAFASKREFVWVARKLDLAEWKKVEALGIKGILTLPEAKRYYPMGTLASQVLGYVGTDNSGLSGLEFLYEQVVAGEPGRRTVVRDARLGTALHPDLEFDEATPGRDLHLTLDATIQHIVERELAAAIRSSGSKSGSVVILDPETSAVLAMASWPTFDPNRFGAFPAETWRNPVVMDAYEPGSTFKMVTLAAALEANVVDPLEKIDCGNGGIRLHRVRIDDHTPFGLLTTREIIAQSSNVGAIKLGMAAGRHQLWETIEDFGFGRPTGVDLPSESPGIVRPIEGWSEISPAYISFGQSLSVTSLQIANAFGAIANGGSLLKPFVVASIGRDGELQALRQREVVGSPIAPSSVRQVRSMLESVVIEGTAKSAGLEGYRVAGKTGTAQKAVAARGYVPNRYIASFVGFVPVEKPALVAAVMLDEPWPRYHGGEVAAPLFAAIARQSLLYLGIAPEKERPSVWPVPPQQVATHRPEAAPRQVPQGTVPDFAGLSARQAVAESAAAGLQVALNGHGRVTRQLPEPGTPVETAGGAVELWLGLGESG